jgi:PHD/YefM family antitoxin component YafN of YafNO toxin-antitoxin module
MKTIDLTNERPGLDVLIDLARHEPVLLLTQDGKEFCLAEADDFEREVEVLRSSPAFQRFLDERSACHQRIPLEEIEKELGASPGDHP